MRYRALVITITIVVVIAIAAVCVAMHPNISALGEPGRVETFVATQVRDWCIHRAARRRLPPTPEHNEANLAKGSAIYGMACATCHGQDGRNPAPIGKSMYPRVPNLSSPQVQGMSDRELFWVIKNGVRLSGMPGFAKIQDDEQIWCVVYFVHSLGKQ